MTTRRFLLASLALPAAAAACHPIVPASIPRHAEDHPDAELLRLVREFEAADLHFVATDTAWEAAEEQAKITRPDRPDGMRRGGDFYLFWGLASNPHSPVYYTRSEIDEFRTFDPPTHEDRPRRQKIASRAAEIVAAFDGWKAAVRAHDEACGIAALDRKSDAALSARAEAMRAVEDAKPRTLDGFMAKARVALHDDTAEFDRILRDDLLALTGDVA